MRVHEHPDSEQKRWLQLQMEPTGNRWPLDDETRVRALQRVIEAEEFEHFLHTRFIGHKRFSIEGAESAMVILDEILDRAANTNVHEAILVCPIVDGSTCWPTSSASRWCRFFLSSKASIRIAPKVRAT